MKNTFYKTALLIILFPLCFSSCEKDNLKGPDAKIFGQIRDLETGEPIQQDIIDGSLIYYIENGFDVPQLQTAVFKNDGSYRNNLMFSGNYKFVLTRGNYVSLDTLHIQIKKGNNEINFEAIPYLRLKNTTIDLIGERIHAKFTLEDPEVNGVNKIGLFVHSDVTVGNGIKIAWVEIVLDRDITDGGEEFEIIYNLSSFADKITQGRDYYFRVGALSSASEARYNYAAPVKITL